MAVETYVILFRGVGGATQLPTAPLREALTEAGFGNVATYINSGNAVVTSRKERAGVIREIAAICRREFGFDKAIHAPTRAEWRSVIERNPFPDGVKPGNLLHAALLAEPPTPEAISKLEGLCTDGSRFAVVGDVAYLHTPQGFSQSNLAGKFDRWIGVPNTARNWNTVLKLMALADKAAGA